MSEEKGTSWYSDLKPDEIDGKHVRVITDSGAVIEGRLQLWNSKLVTIYMGSPFMLRLIDDRWYLMQGVKSIDLVWDERVWKRIEIKDLRPGDAVVANSRLYTVDVAWAHEDHQQVITETPSRIRIDLCLVSCALRRKEKVPVMPGYYRDRKGLYWGRSSQDEDKPWRVVDLHAAVRAAENDEFMAQRLPLTPVQFIDTETLERAVARKLSGLIGPAHFVSVSS